MGLFSFINPVRVAKEVRGGLYKNLNGLSNSLSEFADDQGGFDPGRNRGIFDPLGGKEAKDDAAREAETNRAFKEKRQADIRTGTQRVDDTFSQFDDPFHDSISKAYENYYTPQLDEQ